MTDRIDHAAEAVALHNLAVTAQHQGDPRHLIAAAHVHATLALIEQARIANLVALAGSHNPILHEQVAEDAAETLAAFHEHADLALAGWYEVRPDIAAALGIKAVDHE